MSKGRPRGKPRSKEKHRKRAWGRYLLWTGYAAAILFLLFLIFSTIAAPSANPTPTATLASEPARRKAAIVDQVGLSYPNPEFTEKALAYLKGAGFDVEVCKAEDVTVEFYRTLPAQGYELIVLRTHSTNIVNKTQRGPVFLFTSEVYDKRRYRREQLFNQIGSARVLYDEAAPLYFAIISGFVRQAMVGRFKGTLIIIGGCQSLGTLDMAEALVERGASAVIGWDEWVDLAHNDRAILHLLHALTVEGLTVEEAVERTMSEVGPDPTYKAVLTYYPPERGGYALALD